MLHDRVVYRALFSIARVFFSILAGIPAGVYGTTLQASPYLERRRLVFSARRYDQATAMVRDLIESSLGLTSAIPSSLVFSGPRALVTMYRARTESSLSTEKV